MTKEIKLFSKDKLKFSEKFYKLMDILISKDKNIHEAIFLKTIYYLQFISLFFSEQIQFLDKNSKVDIILIYIQKLIRIKELFRNYYHSFKIFVYIIFFIMIFGIIFLLIICGRTNLNSIYSFNKFLIHTLIKIFIFFEFNIILDCCFSVFCFGFKENNPNFENDIKCGGNDNMTIKIISVIFIIISIILKFLFHIFYTDLFIFSSSCFSKVSCHYDLYMDINAIFNSVFIIQIYSINREIFFIFNLFYSVILLFYYLKYYLYYNSNMNFLAGIFHILYAWTCIFCLIFVYIDFNEKGIVYIISSIFICFLFINLKNKIEKDLFYNNSLFNLTEVHKSLYFINIFKEKLNNFEHHIENKSFVGGLIDILAKEKNKVKIYKLIKEEKNEDLEKKLKLLFKGALKERKLRKYIIELILKLFLFTYEDNPDIYLNISLFYLLFIRNYCQSMYYFQKISFMKLNLIERFAFKRLKMHINKIIRQNLMPYSEQNLSLENTDISIYFKYDVLSHNFFDEITKEMELSLDFWHEFKKYSRIKNYEINYNKVFELTDKIKTTEENIVKMWEDLLKLYNGINEYFYLYNEYIEQIIDDNRKKKDLDLLKKRNDSMFENINSNYYMILFNKDTGIIICNIDKGSEGIIKHCNKRICKIFNYKISELKDENITKLMPKLFEAEHSKYIQNYFKRGSNTYVEKQDFKTFAKDKYNSIIQIKLGLKLFPILNDNVLMAGVIIKENIDDLIILDKDFYIQGMSQKLMKIFNLNDNDSFFQNNQIPFYALCKKFVNFYNMFIRNKLNEKNQDLLLDQENIIDNNNNKIKDFEEKESPKPVEKEAEKIDEINENIQVNENIELEFEIKIPQFVLDYFKVSKKSRNQNEALSDNDEEENEDNINLDNKNKENLFDTDDEENEKASLLHENYGTISKRIGAKKSRQYFYMPGTENTFGKTPYTPTPTDKSDYTDDLRTRIQIEQEKVDHRSNEEKIFIETIDEYKSLFAKEKFNELEDLIDLYNKDSTFNEYKFNLGFDKNKFDGNQILYIVRCIDNQIDDDVSSEKTIGEYNPSSMKYKKEKIEAIKPLFELLKEEQEDLVKKSQSFLKLSMENKKFIEILENAKKEIDKLSKIHGTKKEELLEDENSSQTSQSGYDNDLIQKNKIEEIKSKLLNNSNNFHTIKYIRFVMILLTLFAIVFSIVYTLKICEIKKSLKNISVIHLYMLQSSFLTTQMISIFISLKLFLDSKLKHINFDITNSDDPDFFNYTQYNEDLYITAKYIYNNINHYLSELEIGVGEFLSDEQLISFYWNDINITYPENNFLKNNNKKTNESFPSAMDQFLCNCVRFLKFNNIEDYLSQASPNFEFEKFFNYTTYLIIENGYNSILPEQFKKLKKVADIFSDYNNNKKIVLIAAIGLFAGCCALVLISFIMLIRITNGDMTELFKKISKIKGDKIEERIKKFEIFLSNLNEFREKDTYEFLEETKIKSNNFTSQNGPLKLKHKQTQRTKNFLDGILPEKKNSDSNLFSSGYYLEDKKYIPLTILNEYFIHSALITIFFITFLVLIYIYSIEMIKDINSLLLIEKFFYGKLIVSSTEIVELKCYLSSCQNTTTLNYDDFRNYSSIDKIIKGIKKFKEINDYYNNRFVVDSCKALMQEKQDNSTAFICIKDQIAQTGNNTYNLMKILENKINNIYNLDSMKSNQPEHSRISLFKSDEYQKIEHIFHFYVEKLNDVISQVIKSNLISYLSDKKRIIIILVSCLIIVQILYFFIFMGIYIPRLIHFIAVSRSVIKIIPTPIIMVTQELEKWIESKANNNFSF